MLLRSDTLLLRPTKSITDMLEDVRIWFLNDTLEPRLVKLKNDTASPRRALPLQLNVLPKVVQSRTEIDLPMFTCLNRLKPEPRRA
jgi:hypothetical protein